MLTGVLLNQEELKVSIKISWDISEAAPKQSGITLNPGPYVELPVIEGDESDFQAHFVNAMAMPNKSDPFPCLGAVVDLPEKTPVAEATNENQTGRRRRRRGRG